MPATKVITAVVMIVLSDTAMAVGADLDLFNTVPDPWRTVITALSSFAAAWTVKERNLRPDQLHGRP